VRFPRRTAPNPLENGMLEQMTARLDAYGQSLVLRSHRQQVIASNIANADTPGYVARDFDFAAALQDAAQGSGRQDLARTAEGHMRLSGARPGDPAMGYAVQTQPSQDGNSVDLDRERANFVDNSIRYESTLRFINSNVKTMLSAITGQ
jgi:flagellar basal-body rod protein FlgB